MANLWLGQDAGSWHGQIDLGSYISGYVDGEGCFTVSISPRPTLSAGWEVRPSLSVSQNGDRAEVLLLIQRYFGCGRIRPDRSDRTVKWETRSLQPIRATVIPHFERYPMLSGKQRDFERFAAIAFTPFARASDSDRGNHAWTTLSTPRSRHSPPPWTLG